MKVHRLGLRGDVQVSRQHHGGPDEAVYACSAESAAWWAAGLGREVAPGMFGENLRARAVSTSTAP